MNAPTIRSSNLGMPPWWGEKESAAVAAFDRWDSAGMPCDYDENGPSDPAAYAQWEAEADRVCGNSTCRHCQFWESKDGETGECHGPELNCGTTLQSSACEQWEGRHTDKLCNSPEAADSQAEKGAGSK